ncbi:MAG TPA: DMT family transporter, partial [Ktedonobacterales bacterium]|nr:DMT family transporter [Ktedonobacterales bacterium]
IELRAHWKSYLFLGAFNAAAPYTLISLAELHLTAGLAAILNATTPLFAALVAVVWIHDPLTIRKVLGMALGLLGVGVLVGWSPLPFDGAMLLAVGVSLLGAFCYGLATVYARKSLAGVAPLASATGQQLGAMAVMLPFALPVGVIAGPTIHLTWAVALATLTLALLCTSVAYLFYFYLVTHIGPTSTASVTLLVPVFGLLWSGLFLHEAVTAGALVALLIILSSVFLITGMRLPLPKRRVSGVVAPMERPATVSE